MVFSIGVCEKSAETKTDLRISNTGLEPQLLLDERLPVEENLTQAHSEHQSDDEDGNIPKLRTKRVIGGYPVDESTHQFIVKLYSYNDVFKCGGTLVSQCLVLTAAHCLKHNLAYIKLIGSKYPTQIRYDIERSIPHPDYSFPRNPTKTNSIHDIALLLLSDSIKNAQTVKLIPTSHNGDFTTAKLYGWGVTEIGYESYRLRGVTLSLLPPSDCQKQYDNIEDRICSDGQNGNMCTGDSGGPLMLDEYQIGIASLWLGEKCTDGLPSAYTKISTYRNWIEEKITWFQPICDSHERYRSQLLGGKYDIISRLSLEATGINSCMQFISSFE
ncbi:hypothetical protein QAD02_011937 [Eretmocerus hayati]|uniref:Uncharacterized protein n=1 Tax=Eretmocerus hayati TaxID=131215 RepID=A0ACC2NZY4_9HYME|nr:hypothetical protein QAD02_011937 [Eretmocerus hayati]